VRRDRAIVFDLDDTLYAERRFALSGYAAVARHIHETLGVEAGLVFASLRSCLRTGRRSEAFQHVCDRFGLSPALVPEWRDLMRMHAPRLRLPSASRRVLDALVTTWRLAILTNGIAEVQRRKVAALGLATLVDRVVYAIEHGGIGKPDIKPFLAAAGALGVAPSAVIFVGNDPWTDVWGARNAGMKAIWLNRGTQDDSRCPGGADAVIGSIQEVPRVAAALLNRGNINVA
jgi:putative hydrolase of the HAD superfamily